MEIFSNIGFWAALMVVVIVGAYIIKQNRDKK